MFGLLKSRVCCSPLVKAPSNTDLRELISYPSFTHEFFNFLRQNLYFHQPDFIFHKQSAAVIVFKFYYIFCGNILMSCRGTYHLNDVQLHKIILKRKDYIKMIC